MFLVTLEQMIHIGHEIRKEYNSNLIGRNRRIPVVRMTRIVGSPIAAAEDHLSDETLEQ